MDPARESASRARQVTVRDLMRRDVVTVSPDATLRELIRLLARHRVSGVPVVNEDRKVLGMVSMTDLSWLADSLADEEWGSGARARAVEHLDGKRASDIMTPDVFGVGPDASVAELARFFARTGLRRAVVVERGTLVGIVSAIDLLSLVAGGSRLPVPEGGPSSQDRG
jgi:CBS domain-containing protein